MASRIRIDVHSLSRIALDGREPLPSHTEVEAHDARDYQSPEYL